VDWEDSFKMAIIITYSGVSDPKTGLEWDKPSVETLRLKYPTANVYSGKNSSAININANLSEVNSFVNSFPVGSTIFCVGGEDVNGIAKNLTKGKGLGLFDATPQAFDGRGFIKSVSYNGRTIMVLTGGCCKTPVEKSRIGTINSTYFILNNNISITGGKNVAVPELADRLGLYSVDFGNVGLSEALQKCKEGFVEFALTQNLLDQGHKPEEFEVLTCYIEGTKLYALVVEFGSPAIPMIIWGLIIVGSSILTTVSAYKGFDWLKQREISGVEQARQEAIKKPYEAMVKSCEQDPKLCGTPQDIKDMMDKTSIHLKSQESIIKWEAKKAEDDKSLSDQFMDIAKGMALVGGVGIGIYFLFQSGLFQAGASSVKRKINKGKK